MKDKTLSTVMVIGILTTMPLSANANGWEMTAVDTSGWNAGYEKATETLIADVRGETLNGPLYEKVVMTAVDTSGWNADYEKAIEAIKSLDAAWE